MNSKSLSGLHIAVTRPRGQAQGLLQGLRDLGAEPIHCPTIRIAGADAEEELRGAVAGLQRYDWVIFTSANGVRTFWDVLVEEREQPVLPPGIRVAAIGPATARALAERGVTADVVPEEYVAEAVAEALTEAGDISGLRVLLPRAAGARAVLPERLRAAGARVDELAAYESVPDADGIARLREAVDRGEVDMITFTAASTVRHYVEVAGADIGAARVVAIGPITAAAARELGLRVDVVAREYTEDGLLKAIVEYYGNQEGGG